MAVKVQDVDFSRSTMAYPMPKAPTPVFVDSDIDYAKSTGAYPMYDESNVPERVVEHVGAEPVVQFPTPGASEVTVDLNGGAVNPDPPAEPTGGSSEGPAGTAEPVVEPATAKRAARGRAPKAKAEAKVVEPSATPAKPRGRARASSKAPTPAK